MKKLSLFFALFLSLCTFAQQRPQPPIPVETMFGNNRANFQLSLNRPIVGKLHYNNITIATAPYNVKEGGTELTMVNSFIYRFHRNFGASGGVQYHFRKGFVPNAAFHASYADPVWLLAITPYLNFLPDRNSETIGIVEFKPLLNSNLQLYTRAMALYNHNLTHNVHDRSFFYFRLGITFARKYTLGGGANFDYYGANRVHKDNFGGFFKVDI